VSRHPYIFRKKFRFRTGELADAFTTFHIVVTENSADSEIIALGGVGFSGNVRDLAFIPAILSCTSNGGPFFRWRSSACGTRLLFFNRHWRLARVQPSKQFLFEFDRGLDARA
jgi:hypothetical protein